MFEITQQQPAKTPFSEGEVLNLGEMSMELTPVSYAVIALAVALVVILAAFISRKGVFAPPFERRTLMNQTESRLFKMLRAELPAGWSVMCQVWFHKAVLEPKSETSCKTDGNHRGG